MKNKILLSVMFACFLLSCEKKDNINMNIQQIWNCTNINQKEVLDFQSFFESAKLIPLEETEKSRIGTIDKVVCHNDILYVLDKMTTKKIMAFNAETGKYLSSYGSLGRSQDEYYELNDFSLDEENNLMYVLCNKNKILTFDLNGTVTNVKELPFYAINMECLNNRFYLVSEDMEFGSLIVVDENLDIKKQFFIRTPETLLYQLISPLQKSYDGKITYRRYLDNNIYEIDEKDNMSIRYKVDLGDNTLERYEVEASGMDESTRKDMCKRTTCHIKFYAENSALSSIMFYDKGEPCTAIIDKKRNRSIVTYNSLIKDNHVGMYKSSILGTTSDGIFLSFNPEEISLDNDMHFNIDSVGHNPIIYYLK